nr:hypothetical protein [Geitlerinema sp. PCC 7407]
MSHQEKSKSAIAPKYLALQAHDPEAIAGLQPRSIPRDLARLQTPANAEATVATVIRNRENFC